jgi:TolB-like protein/tetratricopeptide (TPR) repeat protein
LGRLFLSYAREDAATASLVARNLERAGHTIWWDRHLGGGARFAKEIAAALKDAEAVLVLWSQHSIDSSWVQDEAGEGRDSGRLVPVSIDGSIPPLGFRQFQSVSLTGWRGRRNSAAFKVLEQAIEATLKGERIESPPPPATAKWSPSGWRARAALGGVFAVLALAVTAWLLDWNPLRRPVQGPISVAVLPFDAIPPDQTNTPFAEGLSEEISGGLARNPRLQMIGRTSAAMFRDSDSDAKTIGRKLRVAYLLDGTVRRAGKQIRVGVELVRADDGVRLWQRNYHGTLDDIFAIQDRIGQSVEGQLRAKFVGDEGVTARSLATRGDVYAYYLTARGLLREPGKFAGSREESIATAIDLLRSAVAQDPNYAPAWAQLSGAYLVRREISPKFDAAKDRQQAIIYADRALALAPQLAEAHYAKARTLVGPEGRSPENLRGLQTAARLDPNNADVWFSLGNYYDWLGDFDAQLAARRKAVALEPLWLFGFVPAIDTAWNLGFEEEARRYAEHVERDGLPAPFQAQMTRGSMAELNGDPSLELAQGLAARRSAEAGFKMFPNFLIGGALRATGDLDRARRFWAEYEVDDRAWKLWHGQPPSAGELASMSRDPAPVWANYPLLSTLLKSLVNDGRSAEVVDIYRRRFGAPEKMQLYPGGHVDFIEDAATVATALRDVGNGEEADRILRLARQGIDERLRRGRVPRSYHFRAALVAAAQGDDRIALAWLAKSASNKWWYGREDALPDISQEPAFRRLKGNPQFEAIAQRQRAWQAKERREMAPLLAQLDKP